MEWSHALAALLAAVLVAVGFLAARPRVTAVPPLTAELAAELAAVRAEWVAWRKQFEAYLESAEELSDTVERRRKRAAASASRAEAASQGANGTGGKDELVRRARALGIPV